jgi:hypothetical protein
MNNWEFRGNYCFQVRSKEIDMSLSEQQTILSARGEKFIVGEMKRLKIN